MSKFKVGDKVVVAGNAVGYRVSSLKNPDFIGEIGVITDIVREKCRNKVRFQNPNAQSGLGWYDEDLDFYKEPNMKDEDVVQITVGAVKKAAGQCSVARDVLKTLCPEVFKEPEFKVGDIVHVMGNGDGILVGIDHTNSDGFPFSVQMFSSLPGTIKWIPRENITLILRPFLKCEPK